MTTRAWDCIRAEHSDPLAAATALARHVAAADLAGRRMHVLWSDQLPSLPNIDVRIGGMNGPHFNTLLAGDLRTIKLDPTDATVIVVNRECGWFRSVIDVVGVVLHELSHALDDLAAGAEEVRHRPPAITGVAPDKVGALFNWLLTPTPANEQTLSPWHRHGWRFTRLLIHLHHRACAAGCCPDLDTIGCAGRCYGLGRPEWYQATLADECDEWSGRPLLDLANEPLPAAFAELWWEDTGQRISTADATPHALGPP